MIRHRFSICLATVTMFLLAACGSGGGNTKTTAPNNPATPTITVTPASSSATTVQTISLTISVAGSSGTPTGSVIVTSGKYTSTAMTLAAGSATISIPAGSLAAGANQLTATYTPDSASSSSYTTASGSSSVNITKVVPAVTVTPASTGIFAGQSLSVTIAVSGGSGTPSATGSVTVSSGSYSSSAATLSSGSATLVLPPGTLPAGANQLTGNYTPDTAGAGVYSSASGSANVAVEAKVTPTVTVTPVLQNINTQQSLSVMIAVSGVAGDPTATGSVVLTSGAYSSSAVALSSGSVSIDIAAGALIPGKDTLTAVYTPDTASAGMYNSGSGSASVTVTRLTPTVKLTPASLNITTAQSLQVQIDVTVPSGDTLPTGTVVLTGGNYTSSATTLNSGSASIIIPSGILSAGSFSFSATYTPDTAGAAIFTTSSGSAPSSVTVTLLSTVTINQAVSGANITDQLLGMNMAEWWDPSTSYVVPALQAAGIKALRWPGGSNSDEYHWQANMMCQGTPPNLSPGGWAHPNAVYTEFISALQTPLGADVALTANYGTDATCKAGGDPAEAANWVQAWERAGGSVSHVTVGNEEYGNWETDLHAKPHDAATYASAVQTYFSGIKAIDPNVLVGVAVDAGETGSNVTAGWDAAVLSQAKGSYDFVEYHYYPQTPGSESDTYLVHQAALDLTTNINNLKQELRTAGVPGLPIYVGEIGSVFSSPGKQSWSITQGLYAGQVLGEMMNDGISRLTWWIGFGNCTMGASNQSASLYGWQNFGAYNVFSDQDSNCPGEGPGGTMSPTAQAFNLYQHVLVKGESVLTPTVAGDTTDIRAYAATHSGGTALVLFNLNETTAEPVQITLSAQNSTSGVTVMEYSKAMYDQTNAPTPVWASPTTRTIPSPTLPLNLTLDPWSMNVVLIQ